MASWVSVLAAGASWVAFVLLTYVSFVDIPSILAVEPKVARAFFVEWWIRAAAIMATSVCAAFASSALATVCADSGSAARYMHCVAALSHGAILYWTVYHVLEHVEALVKATRDDMINAARVTFACLSHVRLGLGLLATVASIVAVST